MSDARTTRTGSSTIGFRYLVGTEWDQEADGIIAWAKGNGFGAMVITVALLCSGGIGYAQALGKPNGPTGVEIKNAVKDEYFNYADHQWARWVAVNNGPTRIHRAPWSDEKIEAYLAKYVPDHIGLWGGQSFSRRAFMRMRGIPANVNHEYGSNECLNQLHRSSDKCHAAKELRGNGIARQENGRWASLGWAGTHLLCQNAPKWNKLQKQSTLRQGAYGESMFHDKYGAPLRDMNQGYCEWCNRRFIEYMTGSFSEADLQAAGFDARTFSLKRYVAEKRKTLTDDALISDPVLHEYVRMQYRRHLWYAANLVDGFHKGALKAGKPVPAFYGNQSGAWGRLPFAVAICDLADIVFVEQAHASQRPLDPATQADSTLIWKLTRAASSYEKATWAISYQAGRKEAWPFGHGSDKRFPTALANAEALANGGVQCQTWAATPYNAQRISDALLKGHAYHAHFANNNRGLFVDRTDIADHAVVYSFPSIFWRVCYARSPKHPDHYVHFTAAARLLEDSQIPYQALIFGHEDVFDDAKQVSHMKDFKTIILPHVDAISDAQAEAVKVWTRAGGRLVLWAADAAGTLDEEMRPRKTQAFADLIASPGNGRVERIATDDAVSYIAQGAARIKKEQMVGTSVGARKRMQRFGVADIKPGFTAETLRHAVVDEANPIVRTSAPETLWLHVWRHGAGPMTSVQMFNNDLDVDKDTITPLEGLTVSLREPQGVRFTQAFYTNATYVDEAPPKDFTELRFTRQGGRVQATVPRLDVFGVLVFCVDSELEARMGAARTRKWHERLKMALRCEGVNPQDYAPLVQESGALLAEIQGDVAVDDFAALIAPLREMRATLQGKVEHITKALTQAQSERRAAMFNAPGVRKFDFGDRPAAVDSGWTQVTTDTLYSEEQAYGWDGETKFMRSVVRGAGSKRPDAEIDALHIDLVRSKDPNKFLVKRYPTIVFPDTHPTPHPGYFKVDLPNGEYIVTVLTGEYGEYREERCGPPNLGRTAMTAVDAEGLHMAYGDRAWGGFFQNRVFRVKVDDGELNLKFYGNAVGPFYCNVIEWQVSGLVISTPDQKLPPQAEAALARNALLSRAAIRDWMTLGPFDDADCTGDERELGPERDTDLGKSYKGKGDKTIRWQTLPTLTGSAPRISYASMFNDIHQAGAFANTFVYAPRAMDATLVCGLSGTGVIYLNGRQVFHDEMMAGLIPDEQLVPIRLQRGWNRVLIKSFNWWGDEWSLAAGLLTADGKCALADQVEGLKIRSRSGEK